MIEMQKKAYLKQYYLNNAEKLKSYQKSYKYKNPKKRREYMKLWVQAFRKRNAKNVPYRLKEILRVRLLLAIKRQSSKKAFKSIELLGASPEVVKEYIESQFTEGMSWNEVMNGSIHLDHVIPLNWFDFNNPEEQKTACFYKNLQPLWAKDNRKKHDNIRTEDLDKFLREVGESKLPIKMGATHALHKLKGDYKRNVS